MSSSNPASAVVTPGNLLTPTAVLDFAPSQAAGDTKPAVSNVSPLRNNNRNIFLRVLHSDK
jgi:hypothetical protein